ncbi:hypothetical protein RND71_014343 [Anisodus tanguticus]|uniref:Uncharacterized protein n=1 Tax=Anisodus tanguticus TaxID=243964 RepID=A0AAE1S9K8_9SOLA|nr:hypothetical protein RND71_014343 [Anisodus tanguticus]
MTNMMSSSFSSFSCIVFVLAFCAMSLYQAEARAFFVFGDSLVDNGNNNYLVTSARADSPPYGIDYPTHRPTGRFSNGLNIPDIISEQLGMEPTLPYLASQLTGHRLLVGANFASTGVGILNDTGIQFLNIIRIGKQLEYFQQYQRRVTALIGAEQTQQLEQFQSQWPCQTMLQHISSSLVLESTITQKAFVKPGKAPQQDGSKKKATSS